LLFCRAAIDLQIAQEKAQRERLEALKRQELQQEQLQLCQWQSQLSREKAHDEFQHQNQPSVYTDNASDDEDDDLNGNDAIAADAGDHSTSERVMPYHPDYYGRGWRPSRPNTAYSSMSECDVEDADGSTVNNSDNKASDSNTESSSRMLEQQLSMGECTRILSSSNSSSSWCRMHCIPRLNLVKRWLYQKNSKQSLLQ
jgi:hypothetical protein